MATSMLLWVCNMVEKTIVEKRTCDICNAEITESFGGWNRIKKNIHQPDLCENCVRKILTDYVTNLPISPTVTKK